MLPVIFDWMIEERQFAVEDLVADMETLSEADIRSALAGAEQAGAVQFRHQLVVAAGFELAAPGGEVEVEQAEARALAQGERLAGGATGPVRGQPQEAVLPTHGEAIERF